MATYWIVVLSEPSVRMRQRVTVVILSDSFCQSVNIGSAIAWFETLSEVPNQSRRGLKKNTYSSFGLIF